MSTTIDHIPSRHTFTPSLRLTTNSAHETSKNLPASTHHAPIRLPQRPRPPPPPHPHPPDQIHPVPHVRRGNPAASRPGERAAYVPPPLPSPVSPCDRPIVRLLPRRAVTDRWACEDHENRPEEAEKAKQQQLKEQEEGRGRWKEEIASDSERSVRLSSFLFFPPSLAVDQLTGAGIVESGEGRARP